MTAAAPLAARPADVLAEHSPGHQYGHARCAACGARFGRSAANAEYCCEGHALLARRLRSLAELGDRIVADAPSATRGRARWRMRQVVLEGAAGRLTAQRVRRRGDGRVRRHCTCCSTELERQRGRGRPAATCPRSECTRARQHASEVARLARGLDGRGRAYLLRVARELAGELGGRRR